MIYRTEEQQLPFLAIFMEPVGRQERFPHRSCDPGTALREDGFSYSSNFCDVLGVGFSNAHSLCSFKLIHDEE